MSFSLSFTPGAKQALKELKDSAHLEKRFKAVSKALKFLAENPRHPSLRTHQYSSLSGPNGEKVFEAYAEQDTPAGEKSIMDDNFLSTSGFGSHPDCAKSILCLQVS